MTNPTEKVTRPISYYGEPLQSGLVVNPVLGTCRPTEVEEALQSQVINRDKDGHWQVMADKKFVQDGQKVMVNHDWGQPSAEYYSARRYDEFITMLNKRREAKKFQTERIETLAAKEIDELF